MRWILRRQKLEPIPDIGASIELERREVHWDRDRGWDRSPSLQRVRLALPEHLHHSPPHRNRGDGLWAVVACASNVPVGLAWCVRWACDPTVALIEEVAVVRPWQNQGIGTSLVKESSRWMVSLGFERITAHPISGSAWLERLGFVDDGYRNFIADTLAVTSA
ncbi:MAG: GNAT family N-acetyltransferase [Acidimicrobiales bacterium]|nr:GNAT family N-acetyltransferase [Acidimicrobiales bacterium]